MKLKIRNLHLACSVYCASVVCLSAQNTGQNTYDHLGQPAILSAAKYTFQNPGFFMTGYVPNLTAGNPNFFIDKVDPTGAFSSIFEFSHQYLTNDCGGNQPLNCYGIDMVEVIGGGGRFVVASSYDSGCLFALINTNGSVAANNYYNFPSATSISKPRITTTSVMGEFYIAGSFLAGVVPQIYALRVDITGTIIWSQIYTVTGATSLSAAAIIESPYNAIPELVIAGLINMGTHNEGIIMRIDGTNGTAISITTCGNNSTNPDVEFTSISLATPFNGFYCGGFTTYVGTGWPTPGGLMARVSGIGSIISLQRPSSPFNTGPVIGVAQRYSSTYSAFEYYCATQSVGGEMVVYKMTSNGPIFSQPGNTSNEFIYNTVGMDQTGSISADDFQFSATYGLHVFGTNALTSGDFFMNQSCFNGATANCPMPSQQQVNSRWATVWGGFPGTATPITSAGITSCTGSSLTDSPIVYLPLTLCSQSGMPTTPIPGDNSRIAATSLGTEVSLNTLVSVFPNPTTNFVSVSFGFESHGEVEIELLNNTGSLIKSFKSLKGKSKNSLLSDFGLPHGIYFIKVTVGTQSTLQKIVFGENR